jgi:hypothetical protein
MVLHRLLPDRQGYLHLKHEAVLRHAAAAIGSAASGADGESMSDDTPGGSLNVPPSLTSSTLAQVLQSVYKLVRSCPEHVFQFVRNEQPQLLSQLVLAFRALQGSAARLGKLTALTRSLVRVLIACAEQHSILALASAPAGSEPIEVAKEASRSYFSLLINLLLHSSEAVRFTTSATAGALLLASAAPSRGSRSGTGGDECGSGARAAGANASALPTGHVTPPPTRSVTGPGIGRRLGDRPESRECAPFRVRVGVWFTLILNRSYITTGHTRARSVRVPQPVARYIHSSQACHASLSEPHVLQSTRRTSCDVKTSPTQVGSWNATGCVRRTALATVSAH